MTTAQKEYWVYLFFDSNGRCLYVGETCRGEERFKDHMKAQPWWPDVDEQRTRVVNQYESKAEARAGERAFIQHHRPLHNEKHNGAGATRPSSIARVYKDIAYRKTHDAQMAMFLDILNVNWQHYEYVKDGKHRFGMFMTNLVELEVVIPQTVDVLYHWDKVPNMLVDIRNMFDDVPLRWQPRRVIIAPSTYDEHLVAPWYVVETPASDLSEIENCRLVRHPKQNYRLVPQAPGPEHDIVLRDALRKCRTALPVGHPPVLPETQTDWYQEMVDIHTKWGIKPNDMWIPADDDWDDF